MVWIGLTYNTTMIRDNFAVGNYVHVYNRGAKKLPIVKDDDDKWRFLKTIFYFNSVSTPQFWDRELLVRKISHFMWPTDWGRREPVVKILAYCLMPNHYHLLLKEIKEGGITTFMRKFSNSYTGYFNNKYNESGHLFQGAYKAKRINTDNQLCHLSAYIQVKNPFELIPGGLEKATGDFERCYKLATAYKFCSLGDMMEERKSPIIERELLGELYSPAEYKKFVKQCAMDFGWDRVIVDIAID